MKKMLITGGTVFVSRRAAEYFRETYEVYVLNRNSRPQCGGVKLIEGDRHHLGNALRGLFFDAVLDITAYEEADVLDLLDALDGFGDYLMVSSSAVYPETAAQPFAEQTPTGPNRFWGKYGMDKISAEKALLSRVPNAYILRPPYLYGPGNNVYREAFVFDCALGDRPFFLPGDGEMKLQFLHVDDLCRIMEAILNTRPAEHIWNVGNRDTVSVREWVESCYKAAGKRPVFRNISSDVEQRRYFPFYDYSYCLDVTKQLELLPDTKPLPEGLQESFVWYLAHPELVKKKPLLEYIDQNDKEKL